MMRNRKLNRGLIPLVVLVWGLIGYRFWYDGRPVESKAQVHKAQFVALNGHELDTFSLSLPFRDPFLGELGMERKRSPQERKTKLKKDSPLPHITYKGSLHGQKPLGIIVWEGKSHSVWPRESIYNAQITHIDPQYIDLIIDGKTYRIKRGKSIGAG